MMRFRALTLCFLLAAVQPAIAVDTSISGLPAASSVNGTDIYPTTQITTTRKATAAQLSTYVRSQVTKSDVGLGSVDNTADASKNVATAAALAANGANCSAGSFPLGVNASGAVENCTTTVTSVNGAQGTVVLTAADVGAAGGTANSFTGTQTVTNANPRIILSETGQSANEGVWDISVDAKVLTVRTRTDVDGAGVDAILVERGTGTALSAIRLGSNTSGDRPTTIGLQSASGGFTQISGGALSIVGAGTPAVGLGRPTTDNLASYTGSTRRTLIGADGIYNTYYGVADLSASYVTPTTGFSQAWGNDIQTLILTPAGTLATGTVTMKTTPQDGELCELTSTQTITALTLAGASTHTVLNPPTTLAPGIGVRYIYRTSNTTWYRLH